MGLVKDLSWYGVPVLVLSPRTEGELHAAVARASDDPVALSLSADDVFGSWIETAAQSGVIALFAAPLNDIELVEAAQALARGSVYVSPQFAGPIFMAWRKSSYRNVVTQSLTEREREILDLLSRGRSNRQIAHLLFLSPHTVRNHLSRIFVKLDVGDREAASRVWTRANSRDEAHIVGQSD